jgi:hypothetical protein
MRPMRRYRRPPRRQGVVYGPPRRFGDSRGESVVGRLLGPVVIVGAFGLLAVAAWTFAGRGSSPAVSPTPTTQAVASPTASPSPTRSPTAVPSSSPTPTATLPASPSPTPLTIEVREGPGAITFGTQFDPNTLRIVDATTTFPARGRFYWSAQLAEAAGAPELLITVSAYDPATGAETPVSEESWPVENQQATIFLRRLQMQRLVDGPGVYVVRYMRGDILLAEGFFRAE